MDALRERTGSDLDVICGSGHCVIGTLSWLAHGCSAGMDLVCSGRYLRECIWSDLDVVMVGTWMLRGNGYGLTWTLSCQAHGCSAGMDMV